MSTGCFLTKFLTLSPRLLLCRDLHSTTVSYNMASLKSTLDESSKEEFFVAMVTCPNITTAKTLSRGLLENKLVACVNVIPLVTSIFEWEGKVQEDEESMMVIKTCQEQLQAMVSHIEKNHPYEVPEVISMKIQHGSKPYLDWIKQVTLNKSS